MSANITWFIKNNNNYTASYDYYYGNIDARSGSTIEIQAWYNYQGASDVDAINNAKLNIKAPHIDEAYLLKNLTVMIDGINIPADTSSEISYSYNIGTFSGSANNGTIEEQDGRIEKNMHTIILTINSIDHNVSKNVKNLILDIITS